MKKSLLLCSALVLSVSNSQYILAARASLLRTITPRELHRLSEIETTFARLHQLQAKFPTPVVECYKNAFVRSYSGTNNTPAQLQTDHEQALKVRDEWIRYAHLAYKDNIQYDMFSSEVHDFWLVLRQCSKKYRAYLTNFPNSNGFDRHPLLNISASACTQAGESDWPCLWKQKQQFRKAYIKTYCYGDEQTVSPLWKLDTCHWSPEDPSRPTCLAEVKKD